MLKALAVICLLASAAPVAAQQMGSIEELARTPVITLRIAESFRVAPDQATLTTSTEAKAPTAAEALRLSKAKTETLVQAIRGSSIAAKDIQTEGVSINADYVYDRQPDGNGNQRLVGYVARNTVRIKTLQIDRLSTLLDTLTKAGATQVYGPTFGIADPLPRRRLARKAALARGLAEATEYANDAGFTRVQLLSVEEGVSSRVSDEIVVTGSRLSAAPPPAPPPPPPDGSIQPGQIETGVSLTLRYRMER